MRDEFTVIAELRERAEKSEAMNIQLKDFFDQEVALRREAAIRAEKAEAERDQWKGEYEKCRETIWTVTAQRDEAIGDRDQARDERDEARKIVEELMRKWLAVGVERDAARVELHRIEWALSADEEHAKEILGESRRLRELIKERVDCHGDLTDAELDAIGCEWVIRARAALEGAKGE